MPYQRFQMVLTVVFLYSFFTIVLNYFEIATHMLRNFNLVFNQCAAEFNTLGIKTLNSVKTVHFHS